MLRTTLRDFEQGHKSQRRTLQLLHVSACSEDTEIFAIAVLESLSLDVFVLTLGLHTKSQMCISVKNHLLPLNTSAS